MCSITCPWSGHATSKPLCTLAICCMPLKGSVRCACKLTTLAKQYYYIKCKVDAIIHYSAHLMIMKMCSRAIYWTRRSSRAVEIVAVERFQFALQGPLGWAPIRSIAYTGHFGGQLRPKPLEICHQLVLIQPPSGRNSLCFGHRFALLPAHQIDGFFRILCQIIEFPLVGFIGSRIRAAAIAASSIDITY